MAWIRLMLCAILIPTPIASALAIALDEVAEGRDYYLHGFASNTLVRAIRVSGRKVEIVYLEGDNVNQVDRVAASDLMAKSDGDAESVRDVFKGAAVVLGMLCVLDESCRNQGGADSGDRSSKQATNDGDSSSTTNRQASLPRVASGGFTVTNACGQAVRLALRYQPIDGPWMAVGWWNIQPRETKTLAYTDGSYASTSNRYAYFYAETLPDGRTVWSGNIKADIAGRPVFMMELDDPNPAKAWSLNCPGG